MNLDAYLWVERIKYPKKLDVSNRTLVKTLTILQKQCKKVMENNIFRLVLIKELNFVESARHTPRIECKSEQQKDLSGYPNREMSYWTRPCRTSGTPSEVCLPAKNWPEK